MCKLRRLLVLAALPVWSLPPGPGAVRAQLSAAPEVCPFTHEKEMAVWVTPQVEGPAANLTVSVFSGHRPLANRQPVAAGRRNRIAFAADLVPEGITTLTCRLYSRTRPLAEAEVQVLRLPPKANEVKVDYRTGGLIVDGKPFFPFGVYTLFPAAEVAQEEAHHGFTHLAPYLGGIDVLGERAHEVGALLDECAALGLRVHFDLGPWAGRAEDDEKWELIRAIVQTYRDHPALLGWYLADEPDFQGIPAAVLERAHRFVKNLDPYHPTSLVVGNPENAGRYAGACDIIMNDPYPIPWAPIAAVGEATDRMVRETGGKLPVWVVLQAFGSQEVWRREPLPAEARVMAYQALIHGANGIQCFIRRPPIGAPRSRSLWGAYQELAAEVRALTPWLLSGEERVEVRSASSSIHAAAWRSRGEVLVLAANLENAAGRLRLSLPGCDFTGKAEVLFANRVVEVKEGVIEEPLEPLGTRAYLLPVGPAAAEELEIEPGNLVWNPSFELNTNPGAPDGWSLGLFADRGAVLMTDPLEARHGRHSLRLRVLPGGEGLTLRSLPFPVEPGASYRVTGWARGDRPEARFRVLLENSGAAGEEVAAGREWTQFSFRARVAPEAKTSSVVIRALAPSTVWLDLVQCVREAE